MADASGPMALEVSGLFIFEKHVTTPNSRLEETVKSFIFTNY